MDFAPYRFAGAEAADVIKAHVADFDACWADCVEITCRFDVDAEGQVARSVCARREDMPACPAVQACLAQRIRAFRFPKPPEAGECKVYFGD